MSVPHNLYYLQITTEHMPPYKIFLHPEEILTRDFFQEFHTKIYSGEIEKIPDDSDPMCYLAKLYTLFNSEDNPLSTPENQEKVKNSNTHTSMSVGDVIEMFGRYFVVCGIGFQEIKDLE